jgi:ubiquinone/menaquinone biosynthesis C-methylase UbiE
LHKSPSNLDRRVVEDFGMEWSTFDQSIMSDDELKKVFDAYFKIFPWKQLSKDAIGFDLGCGSGRWAKMAASFCKQLHCVEPSAKALNVAQKNLASYSNCSFHLAGVENIPLNDNSMDFGYALGVLHHVPDTQKAISSCVTKLKSGAPLLLYLYYSFENKPLWFQLVWKISNGIRIVISKFPYLIKYSLSQVIACLVYFPLAKLSALIELTGRNVENIPLSAYRDKSFYTMRTDALDRFGTRLEKRFNRNQIREMMVIAGLENIQFSDEPPYWCAVGYKK